jgi:hypothetical protein
MKSFAVIGFMAVLVGMALSCANQGFVADTSPLAIAAGDFTALIRVDGCGKQPQVQEGYTYCRMTEGPVGQFAVTFIAPPQAAKCKPVGANTPVCVDFTIFYPDQSPAYSDSIPFGETSKTIPWQKLTGKDHFTPDDTGFWIYTYTIRWTDAQGLERKTVSDGEIRLRVVRSQVCDESGKCAAYIPLRSAPDNPNYVWTWVQDGQVIRMTTAARTYLTYGSL